MSTIQYVLKHVIYVKTNEHKDFRSYDKRTIECRNTTPVCVGGGGDSIKFWVGMCRRDSENLTLYQTIHRCIVQPYSRLDIKSTNPIRDSPSVNLNSRLNSSHNW